MKTTVMEVSFLHRQLEILCTGSTQGHFNSIRYLILIYRETCNQIRCKSHVIAVKLDAYQPPRTPGFFGLMNRSNRFWDTFSSLSILRKVAVTRYGCTFRGMISKFFSIFYEHIRRLTIIRSGQSMLSLFQLFQLHLWHDYLTIL